MARSQVAVECMLQPVVGAVFAGAMTIAMGLISVVLNEIQGQLDTREDKERGAAKLTNIIHQQVKDNLSSHFKFCYDPKPINHS